MPRDATAPRPLIREAARVPKTCSWRPPGRMQRPGGVSPCRRPPTCLRLQLRRHRHGLGCGCCHGGCGGCLYRCCCCTRGCSMGSMSGRLLLLRAAPAARGRHHCTVVKPLRSTCSSRLRRGPGSNSAVSSLSIRAIRMAEAWAGDALPGSCAMSMGCSRSEHASLQQAHPSAAAHAGEGRAADAIRHRAVARTCLRVAPAATPVKRTRCASPLTLKQCRAASRDGIPAEICYEKFGAFGITRTCSTWAWDVCMAAMHIRR